MARKKGKGHGHTRQPVPRHEGEGAVLKETASADAAAAMLIAFPRPAAAQVSHWDTGALLSAGRSADMTESSAVIVAAEEAA